MLSELNLTADGLSPGCSSLFSVLGSQAHPPLFEKGTNSAVFRVGAVAEEIRPSLEAARVMFPLGKVNVRRGEGMHRRQARPPDLVFSLRGGLKAVG